MGTRLQSLKTLLDIESGGVHMVGIWGVGGCGKTTLAYYAYEKFSHQFQAHCFIDQVREKSTKRGLENVQKKLLSTLLKTYVNVQSVEEGKDMIRSRLSRSNVLIVLDDVDQDEQIEALAGSHEWFGDGSRIIITTRDKHLLQRYKVKIYPASLLSHHEAIQLFNKHAVQMDKPPIEDRDTLSRPVVSYANGLPLALKVLGSLLRDKDKNEWMSALDQMKNIPNPTVIDTLKISYDGLEPNERELFLDIACFHRGKYVDDAKEIFDACEFYPDIGIKVLIEKALITIPDGKIEMHALVQEMGHYIVRGQHPCNPEKHSRVWEHNEIVDMCSTDSATENNEIEAISFNGWLSGFSKLVSNMKKLRLLLVHAWARPHFYSYRDVEGPSFLSNELQYISYARYPGSPFPADFHPTKLVVLKLQQTLQKELWKGYKHLPLLKVLHLDDAQNLVSTPDFDGFPCLEYLKLEDCESLEEIHPSLGNCNTLVNLFVYKCKKLTTFPTIVSMKKLETLDITRCSALVEFPEIQSTMDSLVKLNLVDVGIQVLPSSIGHYCTNLISLQLKACSKLERIEGNFQALKQLEQFNCFALFDLEKLPNDLFSVGCLLRRLDLTNCQLKDECITGDVGELFKLIELNLSGNHFSRLPFSLLKLTRLKLIYLNSCSKLLELPQLPSSVTTLIANGCCSLESMGDFYKSCNRLSQLSLFNSNQLTGAEGLLQNMLHGDAMNHHMKLEVDGLEIPKTFTPPVVRGSGCRLQLPQNWYIDFSGFLMCSVFTKVYVGAPDITLRHEQSNKIGMNVEPALWKERDDDKYTRVVYVSFDSLRHTTWWDSNSNEVSFSIGDDDRGLCSGFGVKLVARENQSVITEIATDSSEFYENKDDYYRFKFKIVDDTKSALKIQY